MRVLRPASVGLIAAAAITVVKVALLHSGAVGFAAIKWSAIVLGAGLLLINLKWKKLHPVVLVAIGAAAGMVLGL